MKRACKELNTKTYEQNASSIRLLKINFVRMKMKHVLTLISLTFFFTSLNATETTKPRKASIGGTIIDSESKQPVEYATIALYQSEPRTLISGGITDPKGFFLIRNISEGQYVAEISFMGFKTKSIDHIVVSDTTTQLDLGRIMLEPSINKLNDVDVIADKASIDYKIDKKVVNVSQQLTVQSGTAVDILENVPSIKVDIDGNVSLRGSSSFTVLIDNRPTALSATDALRQIPASAIENIEIITNPSAKYEPDGATGIINIITKKNAIDGLSGIINTNIGTQSRYGADFTMDFRSNKWHYYFGSDYNNRNQEGKTSSERWIGNINDTINYTNSSGKFTRGGSSWGVNGGADYSFTPKINLGVTLRIGDHKQGNNSYVDYWRFSNINSFQNQYKTENKGDHDGNFYSVGLYYKQIFDRKEHYLEIQGNANSRNGNESSSNISRHLDGSIYNGQQSSEKGPSTTYRFQIDYVRPLIGTQKIETGIQGMYAPSVEENNVNFYDTISNVFVFQDLYSNKTTYSRKTLSVYAIYSGEWGDFGYQAGLRGEYTYHYMKLARTSETFHFEKPGLFPTIHFSYKLPADQQTMLSYTRRINRPGGWQLEPFYTWSDAYNIRRGNPNLEPEYINSIDFGYQKKMGINFISVDIYYRITQNKIERVQSKYSDLVILNSVENVGTDYSIGAEINFNYTPVKLYQVNLMGDLFDYREKGSAAGEDFSQHNFNWSMRMNNIFRVGANTRLQLDFNYESREVNAQGTEEGFFSTNIAAKQDLLKRKLTATLQFRDVFGNAKREHTTRGTDFYNHDLFRPDSPQIMLTLSYKLNNYKIKRERMNGEREEGEMEE